MTPDLENLIAGFFFNDYLVFYTFVNTEVSSVCFKSGKLVRRVRIWNHERSLVTSSYSLASPYVNLTKLKSTLQKGSAYIELDHFWKGKKLLFKDIHNWCRPSICVQVNWYLYWVTYKYYKRIWILWTSSFNFPRLRRLRSVNLKSSTLIVSYIWGKVIKLKVGDLL